MNLLISWSIEISAAEPLVDREVIGFLFADLLELSGDKAAVDTASLSIGN